MHILADYITQVDKKRFDQISNHKSDQYLNVHLLRFRNSKLTKIAFELADFKP